VEMLLPVVRLLALVRPPLVGPLALSYPSCSERPIGGETESWGDRHATVSLAR